MNKKLIEKHLQTIDPRDEPHKETIFDIMREDRERVLKDEDDLRKNLVETLYENLQLPIGIACFGLGAMQNQLYAWSHDFASTEYVGVPVHNQFIGFTGAEWEYLNIFFAQGSAVVLALLGGYFVGQAMWKKEVEIKMDNKKLASIRERKDVNKGAKKEIDEYLDSKKRWLPDFEKALKKKKPRLYRINQLLKSRAGLPLAILAHTAVLSAVHYTWTQRYYEGEMYVGGVVHESVFWNWTWFVGGYSTYTGLLLASYYFFNSRARKKPEKKAARIKKRIHKLSRKLRKQKDRKEHTVSDKLETKYVRSMDKLIRLEKELVFWETLE